MPKRKRAPDEPGAQSQRFLEAAEKAGVDQTGKKFERAFRKVVPPRKAARSKRPMKGNGIP
jgi:hypothetical protein